MEHQGAMASHDGSLSHVENKDATTSCAHRCFDQLRAQFRTHGEDMHIHVREQCWVVVDTEECVAPAAAHVIAFHGADNQTTTRTKMTGSPWKTYILMNRTRTNFAERTSRTPKVDSLNIMELFPLQDMTCHSCFSFRDTTGHLFFDAKRTGIYDPSQN